MNLIKLSIKGISYSQSQNGAYALILNEDEGERQLPIVIGAFEAQSIAIALEKDLVPPRPLTHDLFKSFADRYQIHVSKVIIHKLVDGVFFSSIISHGPNSEEEVIDARTSDAIALALRFNAPIFTYKSILEKAGIYLKPIENTEDQKEDLPKMQQEDFNQVSVSELKLQLDEAVKNENYEKAAKIRDEISKRQ